MHEVVGLPLRCLGQGCCPAEVLRLSLRIDSEGVISTRERSQPEAFLPQHSGFLAFPDYRSLKHGYIPPA